MSEVLREHQRPVPESNPYIIGRPIFEPDRFFGREDVFATVETALRESAQVVLLHGQRRIGKTSVVWMIPHVVRVPGHHFLRFDLQGEAGIPLGRLRHKLA